MSVPYYGDFAEDDTVLMVFNTFSSDDPAASVTITNLADGDIKVHKDGSLTQIVTDGATVVINFDSITGNHMVTIDTSAHADYSTGSEYAVRIEGTTVDGGTINVWIGSFSIERAGGVLALTKLIQAAVITNAAGDDVAADIIAMKAETAAIVADTNELQVDDYPTSIAAIKSETALIVADTNELQSDNVPGLIATLDGVVDTVKAETALIVADTNELQTDDIPGKIVTLDAVVDTVKVDTAAILVDTATTLDTKLNDMQGATFVAATDSLEALRNRGDAAWTGSATLSDSGTAQAGSATTITLRSGAPSVDNIIEGHLVFISAGTGAGQSKAIAENGYNGTTKVATMIGEWEVNPDATSVYEVTPDAITEITAAPTVAQVADAVWDENTTGHTNAGSFGEQLKNDVDAILVDTGDMQSKFGTPAADLSADVAAVKVDSAAILVDTAVIGALGAGLTDLGGMSTTMKGQVNAEADTAIVDGSLATAAALVTVDGIVDAILVDSDTTIPNLIAALNNLSAANVNAEVLDVLNVDTFVEPGQKLPPMDASLVEKIGFLYKAWRNKSTETATEYDLFNDDASTVDQKAVISDDATTATKGEVATGP